MRFRWSIIFLGMLTLSVGCQPVPAPPRWDASAPATRVEPAPKPTRPGSSAPTKPLTAHPTDVPAVPAIAETPAASMNVGPTAAPSVPMVAAPTAAPTPSEKVAWKGVTLTPHAKGPTPLIAPSAPGQLDETDRYLDLNPHLKHEKKSTAHVKMPSAYGELILNVNSIDRSYDQIDGMSDAQLADAETRWAEAKALYRPGAHEASEQAMKALVARYPYWGKGHGALYDLNLHLKRLEEAEYHLKQLIAIQADYATLFTLAELYVQRGKSPAARAILSHLFERRMRSPNRTTTINMLTLYLMVLMDARDAPTLYAVADRASRDYGPEAVFEYHAVLGLALQGNGVEAKRRLTNFPILPPNHPMFAKVQRLKLLINRRAKTEKRPAKTP